MESGAQPGNTNAAKGKRFINAVNKALENRCKADGQDALVKIAEQLIQMALEGDLQAIKEISDRLDGRPQQSIVGADDGPLTIQIIKYAGSDPK